MQRISLGTAILMRYFPSTSLNTFPSKLPLLNETVEGDSHKISCLLCLPCEDVQMELVLDVKRDYLFFMLSLVLINLSNSICAVYLGFMYLIRK